MTDTAQPEDLGTIGRLFWGGFGGITPSLLQLLRRGASDITLDLPRHIGSFFILAVLVSIILGAVASYAFRAHHVIAGMYHGATAPIALAFVLGINTHSPH